MIPLKDNIPTERTPIVTIALIVANIVVYFVLQRGGWQVTSLRAGDWSLAQEAAYPCDLANRCEPPRGHIAPALSVFTAMFMHGGILHLAGNMLFLWIFGNNVEDSMGRVKFLAFYLLGGVAAFALQVLVDPSANVPTVGASGAIAAVLGAYLVLYPRARVITFIFIVIFFTLIELPAVLVLLLWFGEQLVLAGLNQAGNVAVFAHIGGFVFGMAVVRLLARRKPYAPQPYSV